MSVPISARVTEALYRIIVDYCEKTGIRKGQLLRKSVEKYLANVDLQEVRELAEEMVITEQVTKTRRVIFRETFKGRVISKIEQCLNSRTDKQGIVNILRSMIPDKEITGEWSGNMTWIEGLIQHIEDDKVEELVLKYGMNAPYTRLKKRRGYDGSEIIRQDEDSSE